MALTPREVEEVAADLVEADAALLQAARHREVQRARTEADLIRVGTMRGYKNPVGWARHVIEARSGVKRSKATQTPPDLRSSLYASLSASD